MAIRLNRRLQDLRVASQQLAKALRNLSAGDVGIQDLKMLTAMLKELTGVIRNLYELPTQAEAEAQSIARLRLEEDKRPDALEIILEDVEELGK